MGDLEAVFGYEGAQAFGDPVEVAPDIIAMPFWTPEFCDTVIRAAKGDSVPSITAAVKRPMAAFATLVGSWSQIAKPPSAPKL